MNSQVISYNHPFIQSFPAELRAAGSITANTDVSEEAGFIPSIQQVLYELVNRTTK